VVREAYVLEKIDTPDSPAFSSRMRDFATHDVEQWRAAVPACPYVNCDFIYGSSAEVERLWSVAKYILTDQRKRLTPQMFEALLFLKQNKEFWGLPEVVPSQSARRKVKVGQRTWQGMTRRHLGFLSNR
jgi:hypothetical protein